MVLIKPLPVEQTSVFVVFIRFWSCICSFVLPRAKMKISLLPSFLLTLIFQYPLLSLAQDQERLISTWTIPIPLDHPTPTRNSLERRETATWLNPEPNPPSNEIFTIGQIIDLEWTTDFDSYFIFLWQQGIYLHIML